MFNWARCDIRASSIINGISGFFNSALSWTFSVLGFNTDEDASLDKNNSIDYDSRLVESYCAEFNGTTSKLEYTNETPMNFTGDFSMSTRFKTPNSAVQFLISKRVAAEKVSGYEIHVNTTGSLKFIIHSGGNIYILETSITGFDDDAWHHVVAVFESGIMKMYCDGVLDSSTLNTGLSSIVADTENLWIGSRRGTILFGGCICDTRLYSKAITYSQLETETPIFYAPLQGSVYDISANTADGTPTDITYTTQDQYHYNALYGFDLYTDDVTGLINLYVPYVSGTPIVASVAGYTKQGSYPAGSLFSEQARLVESYAADFNGSTSGVLIATNFSAYNSSNFDITVYFNTTSAATIYVFGSSGGGAGRYRVRMASGVFSLFVSATATLNLAGSKAYNDGDWHKLTLQRVGSTVSLIVDGTVEDSGSYSDVFDFNQLRVGYYYAPGVWDGQMYKFTFVDKVILPFQGSTYDVSGNGNHGTPTDITYDRQDSYHYNINNGFDLYTDDATGLIEIYVPYVSGTPVVASIASYTKQSSHPADIWHNGAETKWVLGATSYDTTDSAWNVASTVQIVDTDHILHSASTGYGIAQGYDDMVTEQGNYLFMNVSTAYQYKDVLLFNSPVSGSQAIALHIALGNSAGLLKDVNGAYVFDVNGFPVWV